MARTGQDTIAGLRDCRIPFLVFIGTVSLILLTVIAASVVVNNGVFSYTVDDGNIHLALAKRMQTGLYGINSGEVSAPSSSILWPFLLAAIPASTPGWPYLPLVLDVASLLVAATLFFRHLSLGEMKNLLGLAVVGLILSITLNFASLAMTGKEHALQVALTIIGVCSLIKLENTGEFPVTGALALALAPLIRYENFAITLPACVYLAALGKGRVSGVIILSSVGAAVAFSAYLSAHGLHLLPTSILSKALWARAGHLLNGDYSDVSASTYMAAFSQGAQISTARWLLINLQHNLSTDQGAALLLLSLLLVVKATRPVNRFDRRLSLFALTALAFHMVGGTFDDFYLWCYGYEMYIVAAVTVVLAVLYRDFIFRILTENRAILRTAYVLMAVAITVVLFHRYSKALITVPQASNFHYEIEDQVARFTVGYWRRPVGVEPLGTALWNDNYVLDYGGLASVEVLDSLSAKNPDVLWMDEMSSRHNVELAITYWRAVIPAKWPLVALLHWGPSTRGEQPKYMNIGFYATKPEASTEIRGKLIEFSKTLPKDAVLEFCGASSVGRHCS